MNDFKIGDLVLIKGDIAHNDPVAAEAINKHGIIHYIYRTSTSRTRKQIYKSYCNIYLLDILFRFSKNNHNKNLCVEYFLQNAKFIRRFSTKEYMKNLIRILNNIINDQYITEKNKQILKQFIKNMNIRK